MLWYAFLCLRYAQTLISLFRVYKDLICPKQDILYLCRTEKLPNKNTGEKYES